MTWKILIFTIIVFDGLISFAQKIEGRVMNNDTKEPIPYVNIGVIGRNSGTVSDIDGKFEIPSENLYDTDTLKFSIIGYHAYSLPIKKYHLLNQKEIGLKPRIYKLKQVDIYSKKYKEKILGNTTKTKYIQSGFIANQKGYELGVLMEVKQNAIIEELNININECTYDSLFYRINVYQTGLNNEFINILEQPIYFRVDPEKIKETISVDLKKYNIVVTGNFLITLEHLIDLGPGYLYFSTGFFNNPTYYRKTSQGLWEKAPGGIGLWVKAHAEQ
ncbi:MAG: carboxypeptidase-like regulatory domain-containing protein [Bacteroidetes bacterium]|nr:carboxypeptidase-like regulatory domain-containing protein [Bacteroidota bacterium]